MKLIFPVVPPRVQYTSIDLSEEILFPVIFILSFSINLLIEAPSKVNTFS